MQLFKKENETVQVLCFPQEEAEKGDYLIIEDCRNGKSILVQIVDVQFANVPGLMEDLIRDNMTTQNIFGDNFDPLQIDSQIALVRDARLLMAKIRCSVEGRKLTLDTSWIPSRTTSRISRIEPEQLFRLLGIGAKRPIKISDSEKGFDFCIDADDLDGGLSIITGRKGTGKSHLSKLLMLGMVDYGAPCVVFDVNGEYLHLGYLENGEKNLYNERVVVLEPGVNFKVTFEYAGRNALVNIMNHILEMPDNSMREFLGLWTELERSGPVTIKRFRDLVRLSRLNEHVQEAIFSRLTTLDRSTFFTDDFSQLVKIEDVLERISEGGVLILNLNRVASLERRVVVEFMLSKLVDLLNRWIVKAIFLFAEEAHLYLRETYWEDIVTRMRHLGLFTILITNKPDSIPEDMYRQADSIFLFNFKNENDLNALSKVSSVDEETMKSIAHSLQPHHCLTIGHITREIPIVVKVRKLRIKTMGQTRKFFG